MDYNKQNSKVFLFILLGTLTAFGPLVTDMYLPALPGMSVFFDTTASMVQLGLTSGMAGLAAGQLLFGPLSDKYGRRPLLLISMGVFAVSTVLCIFSVDIGMFIGMRALQGVAASGGIVISRSVATDKFSGKELAKAMAIIGAINGIAPVASPVLGGFFTEMLGWQGIFWILFGIGIVLLCANLHFRESLPFENRKHDGLERLVLSFGKVLRNKRYLFCTLQFGFTNGVLFANIASSPFIMQSHYGLSAMMFSLFFGLNSVSLGVAAALSVRFKRIESAMLWGSVMMVACAIAECVLLYKGCSFIFYEGLLLLLLFSLGLTFTSSTTLAMDSGRENSGTASALFGATGFAFGGIVSPLVGIGSMMLSTGLAFAACASGSLLFAALAVRESRMLRQ